MKSRILVTSLIAVAFTGLGLYFSSLYAAKAPAVSDALYASKLASVPAQPDGALKSLEGLHNQVVVVNFWATWCGPCVQEMPALSTLQTDMRAKNISFIGIGIDSPDAMTEFAKIYQITYPLYVGGISGTQLMTDLGNKAGGLPFTVILNKSGDVVKTYRGKLDMAQLKKDILAIK